MPTVARSQDCRLAVKVYGPPREHPPPHVHVEVGRVGVVVVRLALDDRPLAVWKVSGEVDDATVIEAVRLVEAHEATIRDAWRRIHGDDADD